MGVASQQGTLTRQDTWFRPPFGTGSNCWDQFQRTFRVFYQLLILNTPRYFLDFAFISIYIRICLKQLFWSTRADNVIPNIMD